MIRRSCHSAVRLDDGEPLVGLPAVGTGQRRGSGDHGANRSAVSGSALLWLAPHGGVAGNPGPPGQPQAGPATNPDISPESGIATGRVLAGPERRALGSLRGTPVLSVRLLRVCDGV